MVLKINPKFKALCPALSAEEYSQLEANIVGLARVREEIILWKGVIVDGHNRYEIATKHEIPYDTSTIEFESEQAANNWIIDNQLGRRNLSESQRAILVAKRITAKKHDNQTTVAQNCATTQTAAAKSAEVSRRTMQSAAKVVESHDKSLEKAVVDGKLAVDVAAAVAKLPEKMRAAFETGAVKASAKVINALAKKDEGEIASIVTAARKGITPLAAALGMDKPKPPQPKTPPKKGDAYEPPKKNGTEKNKFDDSKVEDLFGKLRRAMDDRADAMGGQGSHHKACLKPLGEFWDAFTKWRQAGVAK